MKFIFLFVICNKEYFIKLCDKLSRSSVNLKVSVDFRGLCKNTLPYGLKNIHNEIHELLFIFK